VITSTPRRPRQRVAASAFHAREKVMMHFRLLRDVFVFTRKFYAFPSACAKILKGIPPETP
jgi:hypothetical protein